MNRINALTLTLALSLTGAISPLAQGRQLPQWARTVAPQVQTKQPSAQSNDQIKAPQYKVAVESNLVALDVLVTDEDGNVLSSLKRENFRILDNGKPQAITSFASTNNPITIVMLLEYSGIAYDYFAYKGAYWGAQFLNHLDAKDWVALVTYDLKPTIQVDFTHNKVDVQNALGGLSFPAFREANLFDALVDTLDRLDRMSGKKAILLITTGANPFGEATLDETIARIKKTDVTIFCVGMAEREYMTAQTSTPVGYLQAKNQLETFANLTGGLAWFPRFEGEMPSLFRSVVGFLRSEYQLGFSPSAPALDGKYHKLKVEVIGPDGKPLRVTNAKGKQRKVIVYARQGYVAAKATNKPKTERTDTRRTQ
jgi:VWFA-related protein